MKRNGASGPKIIPEAKVPVPARERETTTTEERGGEILRTPAHKKRRPLRQHRVGPMNNRGEGGIRFSPRGGRRVAQFPHCVLKGGEASLLFNVERWGGDATGSRIEGGREGPGTRGGVAIFVGERRNQSFPPLGGGDQTLSWRRSFVPIRRKNKNKIYKRAGGGTDQSGRGGGNKDLTICSMEGLLLEKALLLSQERSSLCEEKGEISQGRKLITFEK